MFMRGPSINFIVNGPRYSKIFVEVPYFFANLLEIFCLCFIQKMVYVEWWRKLYDMGASDREGKSLEKLQDAIDG